MSLSPGTRLWQHDVTALIGEVVMRQLWQATDTQLGVGRAFLPTAAGLPMSPTNQAGTRCLCGRILVRAVN